MKTYVRVYSDYTIKSDYLGNFNDWGRPAKNYIDYEVNFDTLEVVRVTPEEEVIKWQRGLMVRARNSFVNVVWLCSQQPGEDTKLVTNLTTANVFHVNELVAVHNDVFDSDYWEVVE